MDSGFSLAALRAFELFLRPWMSTRIDAVRTMGLPSDLPPDRPLLLAPNHVSWWDGFVMLELRRALRPRAPLYTVMLESELRRFPFFRRIGGTGIDPRAPATIAHAMRGLQRRLAARPDAMVVFFPQGRIWPSHRRPLGFQPGIELLAARLGTVVLPVAVHLEPLARRSPTIFVSVAEALEPGVAAREVEAAVEARLDVILDFLRAHGEDAGVAWPPPAPLQAATGPVEQVVR